MHEECDFYIRVSTDEQRKNHSPAVQEDGLKKHAVANAMTVKKILWEDHSAKNFNRPEWKKYLAQIRKRKGGKRLLLFTRWDRFSRNAPEAYQMIDFLRKNNIEPQAIEQPINFDIPESKVILAIYLAVPEAENERRALNVLQCMRKAQEEGRYMGMAPLGYEHVQKQENGRTKKTIEPITKQAVIVKWVFETIALRKENPEQVWKQALTKGLHCTKSSFWITLRNPVYAGMIFIKGKRGKESLLIPGQHRPIITHALFYAVQDVLNTKEGKPIQKKNKTKIQEYLPLRGHLVCAKCGRKLTGSRSTGTGGSYFYYHCANSCPERLPAQEVNEQFIRELRKFIPKSKEKARYKVGLNKVIQVSKKAAEQDKKCLFIEIEKINSQTKEARSLLFSQKIDAEDYNSFKIDSAKKIAALESQMIDFSIGTCYDIDDIFTRALRNLKNIDKAYMAGDCKLKSDIISSIFPEKLVFTAQGYRTARINDVAKVIANTSGHCVKDRDLKKMPVFKLSGGVYPKGRTSNYLDDLKALACLRISV